MGQSFTPALSSVGFVQLEFVDDTPSGIGATVYVNLRANSISGGILNSTDPILVPLGIREVVTFYFSSPADVTPGTTYYFQPVLQSGDPAMSVVEDIFNYPGGMIYLQGIGDPNFDLWFREGIVPEPSTWTLLLTGATLLWLRSRR